MRIDRPTRKVTFLTFTNNVGITRDTRSVSILDATKDEIIKAINQVFHDELQRQNEPIRNFVKLTVKMCDYTDKQKKDEFSFRLYRCDVNAIEKIICFIDGEQI